MATVTSETMTREVEIAWWVMLLQGICAAIIGLLLITDTGATVASLTILLGIYWFVLGIFDLVRMFSEPAWGWKLLSGIIGIVAGLVLIRHPLWSATIGTSVLVWIIGFLGITYGAVAFLRAVFGGGWGMALSGALSVLLGVLLLAHTLTTVLVLIYTAGVLAIIGGVVGIIAAIALRVRVGSGARRVRTAGN